MNTMKKIITITFLISGVIFCFLSCQKPEKVPARSVSAGSAKTIADLRTLATCSNSCNKRFTEEAYLYATLLADETSGNMYEELYLRDPTGAIHIDLKYKCALLIGDSVRVNLKGFDVNINSNGILEIDSVDHEKHVVKIGKGVMPAPRVFDGISFVSSKSLCDLIQINNVEFITSDTSLTYADAIQQADANRTISDCFNGTLIVRSSAYAKFAGSKPPKGKGSIVGIYGKFSTTFQMYIRTPDELNMNGPRGANCPTLATLFSKNFNDNSITSGGWSTQVVTGGANWNISSTGSPTNAPFARISGYFGANTVTENWLISPAINLSSANSALLSFITTAGFTGGAPYLDVLVSTNYNSGAPNTATWTSFYPDYALATSSTAFATSKFISLNAYKTSNTRIAFKYSSTLTGAATYQLDNILIQGN
jgi:hypothetical protein